MYCLAILHPDFPPLPIYQMSLSFVLKLLPPLLLIHRFDPLLNFPEPAFNTLTHRPQALFTPYLLAHILFVPHTPYSLYPPKNSLTPLPKKKTPSISKQKDRKHNKNKKKENSQQTPP